MVEFVLSRVCNLGKLVLDTIDNNLFREDTIDGKQTLKSACIDGRMILIILHAQLFIPEEKLCARILRSQTLKSVNSYTL